MSVNSRGFVIAANLLLAVIAQSARAATVSASSSVDSPLPTNTPLLIDSLWSGGPVEMGFDNSDAAPPPIVIPETIDKPAPAVKDDLIVPFPAFGAGWVLLMGGAMYRMGKRVVRPN